MKHNDDIYAVRLSLELHEEMGVYTVTSPDVPGLVTEGVTPEEIQQNVTEVLQGLLEVWADLGMEIPLFTPNRRLTMAHH